MSLWDRIKDVLCTLASTTIEGSTSGYFPLTIIGRTLIANGGLQDYRSGEATKQQLALVLAEIKKHGDSCEIKVKGKEIIVRVNFHD